MSVCTHPRPNSGVNSNKDHSAGVHSGGKALCVCVFAHLTFVMFVCVSRVRAAGRGPLVPD